MRIPQQNLSVYVMKIDIIISFVSKKLGVWNPLNQATFIRKHNGSWLP